MKQNIKDLTTVAAVIALVAFTPQLITYSILWGVAIGDKLWA